MQWALGHSACLTPSVKPAYGQVNLDIGITHSLTQSIEQSDHPIAHNAYLGLAIGVLITVILGLLCFYTINLLVDAERMFARSKTPIGARLSYPQLCRQVFGEGGRVMEIIVNAAISCIAVRNQTSCYLSGQCVSFTSSTSPVFAFGIL